MTGEGRPDVDDGEERMAESSSSAARKLETSGRGGPAMLVFDLGNEQPEGWLSLTVEEERVKNDSVVDARERVLIFSRRGLVAVGILMTAPENPQGATAQ